MGCAPIDETHQNLFHSFNRLVEVQCDHERRGEILQVFDELATQALQHFAIERTMLNEVSDNGEAASGNESAHRGFLHFVEVTRPLFEEKRLGMMQDVTSYLGQWILFHVLEFSLHQSSKHNLPLQRRRDGVSVDTTSGATQEGNDGRNHYDSFGNLMLGWIATANTLERELQRANEADVRASRMLDFHILLAHANQAVAEAKDEQELFERICQLATQCGGVVLAYIGRPDEKGALQFLCSAGPARGYLDGNLLSIDPGIPEGRGSAGCAWREQRAYFNVGFTKTPFLSPWRERALRYGLEASASLPIKQEGRISAMMGIYAREEGLFDEVLQNVLVELAENVSRGLDRLALMSRERESHHFTSKLLDSLNVGVCVAKYPGGEIELANAYLHELIGNQGGKSELPAMLGSLVHYRKDMERLQECGAIAWRAGRGTIRDIQMNRLGGELWHADLSAIRLDSGDSRRRILWTLMDVSERQEKEEAIQKLSKMRATLLSNTIAGIDWVRYPDRVIVEVNQGFLDILGYTNAEEIVGKNTSELYFSRDESDRMAQLAERIFVRGSGELRDVGIRRRDGSEAYVDVHGRRLEDSCPEQPVIIYTSVDVTERRRLTLELTRQAQVDPLTGLPNRRALEQHLSRAIERASRHNKVCAVGVIDLDDFKPINDEFGHETGDELLVQIGHRLQAAMRTSDFIARFGGDEFILVIEDIEEFITLEKLEVLFERLHSQLVEPFEIGKGCSVRIDMSMGVALFPIDADEPDALLRLADAAMYQAKAQRKDRKQWWFLRPIDGASITRGQNVEPFGPEAQGILERLSKYLKSASGEFVQMFYASIESHPETGTILSNLGEEEYQKLKKSHQGYFEFLLSPEATVEDIQLKARKMGAAHALTGMGSAWMGQTTILYRDLVHRHLSRVPHALGDRHRAAKIFDARLDVHSKALIAGMKEVEESYSLYLSRPSAREGSSWASVCQNELDSIGRLPGIVACELLRPDSNAMFSVEFSAGSKAPAICEIARHPDLQPRLDARHPAGKGYIPLAWRTEKIQRVDSYAHDPRTVVWRADFSNLGVRSLVAIPLGETARTEFILCLQGAYPGQFSSSWMQAFLSSLQNRWYQLASLVRPNKIHVSQDEAASYRQLLYSGGLSIHVQPIVDLRTGKVDRAEALARLVAPDGQIVSPGLFLPAFRDSDLDALFRSGLELGLENLRRWDDKGLVIGLSINLLPSTMVHPECARWVKEALCRFDVRPERVTMEMLESQQFEEKLKEEAMGRLVQTGVKLAVDDLGSGYSNFQRLANCTYEVVKVDQALIREMPRDPLRTLSLIRTIRQMGSDLDIQVVVEGLETPALIEAACLLGTPYGQGYGISKPMPAEELPGWCAHYLYEGWDGHQLKSFLGALTYHWLLVHQAAKIHELPLDQCLLTDFLHSKGLETSKAARWHEQVHAQRGREDESHASERELTQWLIRRSQKEAEDYREGASC
jgi:diguanylate cyclase (GGDEF)-like protein/PAS domain S-box-containing protein